MEKEIGTKTVFGCIAAVLAYLKGNFNELLVVLAILMICDYILGTLAGLLTVGFDKEKGIRGAIKKLGYIFLVLLGFLLDFTLSYLAGIAGTDYGTNGMFGYTVTCYLIGTEGLSCLRALTSLGLPVPQFLSKAFGLVKDKAEQIGGKTDE